MPSEQLEHESDIIRRAISLLQERLPQGWQAHPSHEALPHGHSGIDLLLRIDAPDGSSVLMAGNIRRTLTVRDLQPVLDRLRAASSTVPSPTVPLLISRHLSSSARRWLDERGVSYLDATGNIRVASVEPALYLRDRGADVDPWRGPGRPRSNLAGLQAGRVVRALADLRPPMPVTGLIAAAGVSTGVAYRVLGFLEQEALIVRGVRGVVEAVEWRRILERWSEDYNFQRDNTVTRFLQPRGLKVLLAGLAESRGKLKYAVTGSLAAGQWAPYAPPRLATVYSDDVDEVSRLLDLRRVETGANVLMATVFASSTAFDRTSEIDGVTYAAVSQVAVDLLTGPGRSPSEALALLDWMESHESAWRRERRER